VLGLSKVPDVDAAGQPRLVQEMTSFNEGATSLSVSLPALPESQHLLLLIGGAEGGVLSPTGGGVTWQTAAFSSTSSGLTIWFGITDGSSATVTLPTTNTSPIDRTWLDLSEWSGLATANELDGHDSAGSNAAAAVDLKLATAAAPDLLVFAVVTYTPSPGLDASWTSDTAIGTGSVAQAMWHKVVTTAGMQEVQTATAGQYDAGFAAFRTP
jgi:hypothetical protein